MIDGHWTSWEAWTTIMDPDYGVVLSYNRNRLCHEQRYDGQQICGGPGTADTETGYCMLRNKSWGLSLSKM